MPIDRIKLATVEYGLIGGVLSAHQSHHPTRVQSLPALLVGNSGANRICGTNRTEVPDMGSSRFGHKVKQSVLPILLLFSNQTVESFSV